MASLGSAIPGHFAERQMSGDRDRAQGRAREHHDDIARRYPAPLGDELGLPGMLEADGVELLFRHRACDDGGSRAGTREAYRNLE